MAALTEVLRERALEHPEKLAFISADRRITYCEFDQRVDQASAALAAAGVGHGDRVAILDKNSVQYLEQLYGAGRLGAVQVPVNYRLAPDEVAYIVNDSQAKVFIVGPEFLDILKAVEDKLEHATHLVVIDGTGHEYVDYETWLGAHEPTPSTVQISTSDVFVQLYSSGTTGLPKGVMLTHDNFRAVLPLIQGLWEIVDDSVMMIAMPMYHVAGSAVSLITLYEGITGVVMREPDPVAIVRAFEEHRVTHVFLVPILLLVMQQMPQAREADLSSLRLLLYGASPISEDVLRGAMGMLPGTKFMQVYGLTETTGAVVYLPPADHVVDGPNAHRLKAAGIPNPGCTLKIVDPATAEELPVGEVGEILCRTDQNMKGYWNLPDATATSLLPDGWFRTGDAGYLDDDGYLYIHDRVKDMIISGGENIYPAEVENILMSHPNVADCAVIGIPDEKWGETPRAIVVLSGDVADREIIDYCRERLAHFKCPTSVERRDAIPRNPTGKVLKRQLRAPYWEGQTRAVH